MSTRPSQRHRIMVRAARAWKAGKPHTAWEIMMAAGLDREWPLLKAELLRQARKRFEREIARV